MASAVYPKYKRALMDGSPNVNLVSGSPVKAMMVDLGAYTYDPTHEFLSDVPSGARIGISSAISGKSVSNLGAFVSGNARLDGITGASTEAIILFIDTGVPTTSRLVAYYETASVTGLPVTPAGESYNTIPDTGGIWFTL